MSLSVFFNQSTSQGSRHLTRYCVKTNWHSIGNQSLYIHSYVTKSDDEKEKRSHSPLIQSCLSPQNYRKYPVVSIRYASTTETNTHESHASSSNNVTKGQQMKKIARRGGKMAKKGALSAREMIKKYGSYFVGTWLAVYSITLGGFYVGIDSGLLDPTEFITNFHMFGGGTEAEASAQGAAEILEEKENVKNLARIASDLMQKWEWTKPYAETVEKNPRLTNLAIAWVCTKISEPLRLLVVLPATPRVAKYFGKEDDDIEDEKPSEKH